jgi:hypothetical protein
VAPGLTGKVARRVTVRSAVARRGTARRDPATGDLSAWRASGRVIILDAQSGQDWVLGSVSGEKYLKDSLPSVRQEAREEVAQLLNAAT